MNLISRLQFLLLKKYYPPKPGADFPELRRPLEVLLGETFPSVVKDRLVVDFGCGFGADAAQMARWGARLSVGLEIRQELVDSNRLKYQLPNLQFHTSLPTDLAQKADLVISIDAFEHFDQPALMLELMYNVLKPGGKAYITFGPLWKHPYGGHFFSPFAWAHLLLREEALVAWRNLSFPADQARTFGDVSGGLNQMTITTFKQLIHASPFKLEKLELPPIKGRRWIQRILGLERGTSEVKAILCKS